MIVAASVRPGNAGTSRYLAERVLGSGETLAWSCKDPLQAKVLQSLTTHEGFLALEETCYLLFRTSSAIRLPTNPASQIAGRSKRVLM